MAHTSDNCTASLLPTREHVLTAAHCSLPATIDFDLPSGTVTVGTLGELEHPDYTPSPWTSDIAIVRLDAIVNDAPTYDVYRHSDELTQTLAGTGGPGFFELVGYGRGGDGTSLYQVQNFPSGTKRLAFNNFDALGGDLAPLTDLFPSYGGKNPYDNKQLFFDFDNPSQTSANDTFGFYGIRTSVGQGTLPEGLTASGDSGGPSFIYDAAADERRVAAVTSAGFVTGAGGVATDIDGTSGTGTFGDVNYNTRVSHFAEWVDGPEVVGVAIGSSAGSQADYEALTVGLEQLKTVPIGSANRITVRFDQDVNINETDIGVFGLTSGTNYSVTPGSFSYNSQTFEAAWSFTQAFSAPSACSAEQLEISVANVTSTAIAMPFDGDWINPASSSVQITEGQSGNDHIGGNFQFNVMILPGDFNQDNAVDGQDWIIWNGNKFGPGDFNDGDGNGDGVVDGQDFLLWNDAKFTNWQNWPAGGCPSSLIAPVEALVPARIEHADPLVVRAQTASPTSLGPNSSMVGTPTLSHRAVSAVYEAGRPAMPDAASSDVAISQLEQYELEAWLDLKSL